MTSPAPSSSPQSPPPRRVPRRATENASRTRRSIAEERASVRRPGWTRLARTVVLGCVAVTAAIIWGAEQFGLERDLVLEFLTGSLLFVGGLALMGLLAGLAGMVLIRVWRKLTGSDG